MVTDDGLVRVFGRDHEILTRIPTPVGTACNYCEEMFIVGDVGFSLMECSNDDDQFTYERVFLHHACFMRGIIGSVAHIEKRCSCFGPGGSDQDDPGLSRREAAEASLAAYQRGPAARIHHA